MIYTCAYRVYIQYILYIRNVEKKNEKKNQWKRKSEPKVFECKIEINFIEKRGGIKLAERKIGIRNLFSKNILF